MWDCILVHHSTRRLYTYTQEAWETLLGATVDYPRIYTLLSFLKTRARARERMEASRPQPSSTKSHSTKIVANQVSTSSLSANQQQKSPPHPCDCWNEDHFIVSCPKFRDMVVAQREHVAVTKKTVIQLS